MKNKFILLYGIFIVLFSPIVLSDDKGEKKEKFPIPITKDLKYVDVSHNGKTIRIQRNQNAKNRLNNSYTKTSRVCPPFCVQPLHAYEGVKTVGELELIYFIQDKMNKNKGLLIDGRLPSWNNKATIPGSINLPFTVISNNLETTIAKRILLVFGADRGEGNRWDFSEAQDLLFFGNGAWGDQSIRAIRNLIDLGYPPEKVYWYRGGLQSWFQLGFTVVNTN
jgi:hypothetical protein